MEQAPAILVMERLDALWEASAQALDVAIGTDKGLALSSQRNGMSASRSDDRAGSQDLGSSALPCGQ